MNRRCRGIVNGMAAILLAAGMLFFSACGGDEEHTHTPEEVPAKEPTCTENGNRAYYLCTECHGMFADAECRTEVTKKELCIPALGHLWDGDCDTLCNRDGCGGVREPGSHTDADEDGRCDYCGKEVPAGDFTPDTGGVDLPKDPF